MYLLFREVPELFFVSKSCYFCRELVLIASDCYHMYMYIHILQSFDKGWKMNRIFKDKMYSI